MVARDIFLFLIHVHIPYKGNNLEDNVSHG